MDGGGGHRLRLPFPGTDPFDLNLSVLTATLSADPREGRGPNGDPVTLLWVEYPVADPAHPQTLRTWASCLVEVSGDDAREQAGDLRGGEAVLASGQLSSRWVIENGHTSRRGAIVATLIKAGSSPSQLELPQRGRSPERSLNASQRTSFTFAESRLSQEALGMRAALHRTEISLLERGTRMPQLDTVLKIAGAFDISPCELLDGMRWTPGSYSPGGFDVNDRSDAETEGAHR